MGYFADVTAGQRLEDMDISVHCDLQIFEWLIRWVKRESTSQETWCSLDSTNVVPILVSASFLQVVYNTRPEPVRLRNNKILILRWNHFLSIVYRFVMPI